jgi:hypothetical protein
MSLFEYSFQTITEYNLELITEKKNNINFYKNLLKLYKICKFTYKNEILQKFCKNINIIYKPYNHLPYVIPSIQEIEERHK